MSVHRSVNIYGINTINISILTHTIQIFHLQIIENTVKSGNGPNTGVIQYLGVRNMSVLTLSDLHFLALWLVITVYEGNAAGAFIGQNQFNPQPSTEARFAPGFTKQV